jgi:bacillithiol biosynthesis deacetylase BshB1
VTPSLPEPVDVLAFGAHPDDVEMCSAGLLLKTTDAGGRAAIVDLTRGEGGTRGTPETRAKEAAEAARRLGLAGRDNLGLPDTRVTVDPEALAAVTAAIRRWRPRVVLAPITQDLHPDHVACAELVKKAYYLATIVRAEGGGLPPHRPDALVHYFGHREPAPSFVVDVSEVWERRMHAIFAYESQLSPTGVAGPVTNVSAPDFLRRYESRFAYWGSRIGAEWGEPYLVERIVPMDDPVAAFRKRGSAVI